ncbi:coiled-coil domain-containing protein 103 isoform X2 [Scyliorhinus canicula]|uniref:coiled-coil domain-containing protein 103 isoform X2 n=1 Tax=Scyliorhinus canicula TaxID=7830 RepID=UPI0018F6F3DD|nr:coiled-coil domain-containing protein 103 isoform X2 [Scyliorhinus canicula]
MEESETLDFKALETELQTALFLDEKYKRENDAKFRAIHQKVGSYEEFRDIVLASHLKPLDLRDKLGARNQPWNICARSTCTKDNVQVGLSKHSNSQPKTAEEFSRDWRRYYSTEPEKYTFLLNLGGQLLGKIFHTEIGFGFLGYQVQLGLNKHWMSSFTVLDSPFLRISVDAGAGFVDFHDCKTGAEPGPIQQLWRS